MDVRTHSGLSCSTSTGGILQPALAKLSRLPRATIALSRRSRCRLKAARCQSDDSPGSIITFKETQQIAQSRGMRLSVQAIGPAYKIECWDDGEQPGNSELLAMTTGFVARPFGLMHCDVLQVFTKGRKGDEGQRVRRGPLGLGLLLGAACFSWGLEQGCTKAEILAIDDDDYTHRKLVTYYRYFGFVPVRRVTGSGLRDLPDMLVWGGAGLRMDADLTKALRRWTPAVRQQREQGGGGGGATT